MAKAADIMSPVTATLLMNSPVGTAIQLMAEKGLGYLPIVDAAGTLKGWLTEGDLMRLIHRTTHAEESGRQPAWFSNTNRISLRALPLVEVVTTSVDTVSPDTSLEELAELVFRKQRKVVPVVDNGKLAGVIHRLSVIQALL